MFSRQAHIDGTAYACLSMPKVVLPFGFAKSGLLSEVSEVCFLADRILRSLNIGHGILRERLRNFGYVEAAQHSEYGVALLHGAHLARAVGTPVAQHSHVVEDWHRVRNAEQEVALVEIRLLNVDAK